jgi:hypothetical protein
MLRASARYSRARPRQSMAKPPCIGLSEFFDFSFNFFQTLPTSPSDRQCYFSGIPNLRGRSRRTTGYGDAAVAFPISDVDPKCRRLRFQLDDNLNLLYGSHKSEFANPVVAPAARHWSHSPDVPQSSYGRSQRKIVERETQSAFHRQPIRGGAPTATCHSGISGPCSITSILWRPAGGSGFAVRSVCGTGNGVIHGAAAD